MFPAEKEIPAAAGEQKEADIQGGYSSSPRLRLMSAIFSLHLFYLDKVIYAKGFNY